MYWISSGKGSAGDGTVVSVVFGDGVPCVVSDAFDAVVGDNDSCWSRVFCW